MTNIMESCVGKILSFLVGPAITHGDYVIQYKKNVTLLEQENRRLRDKKDRIQGRVDLEMNYGKVIETEVSSWLEEVNKMERDIANFLRQQENEEQMERDIASFLRQQENGEQMERDFANFLCQQENKEQTERDIANFLRQQQNGEQMERDFANFRRQQPNGESFRCFLGCMCPNLMWRHKRGKEAHERKEVVSELISRGENLERLPVARDAPFRSDLHFVSPRYYTKFQSRDSVVDKINNALKDSGVHVIGVHGPGGAGKTTMVIEVANEATKQGIFDKFVVAVVSKDLNISKIQEELASQLDFNYKKIGDIGRADELRKALSNRGKKILVILDDLWQVQVLNAIGIPTSGCKILLTSRNEEVLRGMEVHLCVPIGYLEEQEALKLFTNVTGDFRVDDSTAREVCNRCGGLPIAIVAVGAALRGKEEAAWWDALHQLENCRIKYIEERVPRGYITLRWSYDFLEDEDAKSCFLLCCLFPEDAEIPIDDLVRYSFALGFLRMVDSLKHARYRVQSKVDKLKSSCLLLNGKNKNFVKMHDVIRDLAISITEEKQIAHGGSRDWPGQQQFMVNHNIKEWPKNDAWEHHTAISLRINNDNISFPRGALHCPLMQTIVLHEIPNDLEIPTDFFQGMKEARVLDLKYIRKDLPSSILELDQLRMLRLNYCQLWEDDLSTIQNLNNNIEILSFEGSKIKELPQEIGKLTSLRSLDLRKCYLNVIPEGVISNLIHLEELYVTDWDITIVGGGMSNASITELKSLKQLTVLHITIFTYGNYRTIFQECGYLFEKLIDFFICINTSFFRSLNELRIRDIHDIDGFHLLMDKVEILELSNIQDLRYLRSKPQLQVTPSGGGSFSKLINLDIFKCQSMKYVFSPSCAKALQQLKTLKVHYCNSVEQIIGVGDHCNEGEVVADEIIIFSRLRMINLSKLPQFKSFYPKMEKIAIEENASNWTTAAKSIFNEKVSFPVLEELTINELPAEDIWNEQTIQSSNRSNKISFSQLRHIKVTQCHKLVNVFPSNMFLQLQNLETLRVQRCSSLALLAEILKPNIQSHTIKVFPKLRHLELLSLPKLMKIWPNDEDYCSNDNYIHLYLKIISIICCGSLRHVFPAFVARHLVCIEDFAVYECPKMEVIVSEASIEGVIDDGIIEFCQLKTLTLGNLPNLKSFSQSKSETSHLFNQVIFSKIKYVILSGLSREIQLWDLLATTQEHLHVKIIKCQVSTKVSSHPQMRSSRMIFNNLLLRDCQGFKHVIDLNGTISIGEKQFVDVKRLTLHRLPELVFLWNMNFHGSLKEIVIKECSQLRSLFTHSMAKTLQHLKMLSVISCEMIEEIIIIEEKNINFAGKEKATRHIEFPKLKKLYLNGLPNLKNFCNDERDSFSFSSLCNIQVKRCPKMKTFASGQICLPPRMIRAWVEYKEVEITDLNAFFESRNEDNNHMMIKCRDDSDEGEYDSYVDISSGEGEYDLRVNISSEDD
ncbi:probable disease resistance protein At4g27220 isoform X2 [Diospyros lotus]|uniref:probable disease resistance protein At4g27220 isoform X2 n=1 Tax=Diospyros lotus TaxID=55363 RepID=UPI002259A048|nr:probable disease resistance protein At4g27220 isoform X2 [Diospyros lotus]